MGLHESLPDGSHLYSNLLCFLARIFLKHIGVTMDEFYAEFEAEMESVNVGDPASFPDWTRGLPETSFTEAVDYRSIESWPVNED